MAVPQFRGLRLYPLGHSCNSKTTFGILIQHGVNFLLFKLFKKMITGGSMMLGTGSRRATLGGIFEVKGVLACLFKCRSKLLFREVV